MVNVSPGPALVNPAGLDTVDDLRRALHEANKQLLDQSMRAIVTERRARVIEQALHRGVVMLTDILVAHSKGDAAALTEALDSALACVESSIASQPNATRH